MLIFMRVVFILIPDFFSQVFVTAAVQIGNSIFKEWQHIRVIKHIHRLLQRDAVHLAYLLDDSRILGLKYSMKGIVVYVHNRILLL